MVILLLAVNLAVCWSGLELLAAEGRGPLAAISVSPVPEAAANADERREREREDEEDRWEDLHEGLAELALALVLVHVAGVIVSSVLHRENLVRAMITGRKRRPARDRPDA